MERQEVKQEAFIMADHLCRDETSIRDKLAYYIQKSWDAFPILKLKDTNSILKDKQEMDNPCE